MPQECWEESIVIPWPSFSLVPGSVLYISLHRYDQGSFFPVGDEGSCNRIGRGAGTGFTVNVGWNTSRIGDSDYLMAWHRLVLPIAYEVWFRMYVIRLWRWQHVASSSGVCV